MRWLPIIGILIIIATIIIFTVDGIRSAIRTSKKRRELLKSGSPALASPAPKTGRNKGRIKPLSKTDSSKSTDISSVLSNFKRKE